MRNSIVTICFLVVNSFVYSQLIVPQKFGKGLYNVTSADSSWSMKLGVRFQFLYSGAVGINDTSGFGQGTNNFLIRRSRLKFDGHAFSPKLKYKIEFGLSNRDIGKASDRTNNAPNVVMDAVVMWNFAGKFWLWAGQTKLPGNIERVISSANMQFVDRSLLNSNFNIDRDIGLQLRHSFQIGEKFTVREKVAVSQGEGRNVVQSNLGGMQYTGRIELLPFGTFKSKGDYIGADISREQTPKLMLAATYDYNDRAVRDRSNQGNYMMYDDDGDDKDDSYFHSNIQTFFADMMFKYKGFSLMGEYAFRTADDLTPTMVTSIGDTVSTKVQAGSGANIMAGYLFKNNWEVSGRYTYISPNAILNKADQQQVGLGVSRYIAGHALKVQADVNYLITNNSPDKNLMYRLQMDIHF